MENPRGNQNITKENQKQECEQKYKAYSTINEEQLFDSMEKTLKTNRGKFEPEENLQFQVNELQLNTTKKERKSLIKGILVPDKKISKDHYIQIERSILEKLIKENQSLKLNVEKLLGVSRKLKRSEQIHKQTRIKNKEKVISLSELLKENNKQKDRLSAKNLQLETLVSKLYRQLDQFRLQSQRLKRVTHTNKCKFQPNLYKLCIISQKEESQKLSKIAKTEQTRRCFYCDQYFEQLHGIKVRLNTVELESIYRSGKGQIVLLKEIQRLTAVNNDLRTKIQQKNSSKEHQQQQIQNSYHSRAQFRPSHYQTVQLNDTNIVNTEDQNIYIEGLKRKLQNLEEDNNYLDRELKTMTSAHQQLLVQKQELQQQLQLTIPELEEQIQVLQSECRSLKAEKNQLVEKLHSKVISATQNQHAMQEELAGLQQQNIKLNRYSQDLERQLDHLKQQLSLKVNETNTKQKFFTQKIGQNERQILNLKQIIQKSQPNQKLQFKETTYHNKGQDQKITEKKQQFQEGNQIQKQQSQTHKYRHKENNWEEEQPSNDTRRSQMQIFQLRREKQEALGQVMFLRKQNERLSKELAILEEKVIEFSNPTNQTISLGDISTNRQLKTLREDFENTDQIPKSNKALLMTEVSPDQRNIAHQLESEENLLDSSEKLRKNPQTVQETVQRNQTYHTPQKLSQTPSETENFQLTPQRINEKYLDERSRRIELQGEIQALTELIEEHTREAITDKKVIREQLDEAESELVTLKAQLEVVEFQLKLTRQERQVLYRQLWQATSRIQSINSQQDSFQDTNLHSYNNQKANNLKLPSIKVLEDQTCQNSSQPISCPKQSQLTKQHRLRLVEERKENISQKHFASMKLLGNMKNSYLEGVKQYLIQKLSSLLTNTTLNQARQQLEYQTQQRAVMVSSDCQTGTQEPRKSLQISKQISVEILCQQWISAQKMVAEKQLCSQLETFYESFKEDTRKMQEFKFHSLEPLVGRQSLQALYTEDSQVFQKDQLLQIDVLKKTSLQQQVQQKSKNQEQNFHSVAHFIQYLESLIQGHNLPSNAITTTEQEQNAGEDQTKQLVNFQLQVQKPQPAANSLEKRLQQAATNQEQSIISKHSQKFGYSQRHYSEKTMNQCRTGLQVENVQSFIDVVSSQIIYYIQNYQQLSDAEKNTSEQQVHNTLTSLEFSKMPLSSHLLTEMFTTIKHRLALLRKLESQKYLTLEEQQETIAQKQSIIKREKAENQEKDTVITTLLRNQKQLKQNIQKKLFALQQKVTLFRNKLQELREVCNKALKSFMIEQQTSFKLNIQQFYLKCTTEGYSPNEEPLLQLQTKLEENQKLMVYYKENFKKEYQQLMEDILSLEQNQFISRDKFKQCFTRLINGVKSSRQITLQRTGSCGEEETIEQIRQINPNYPTKIGVKQLFTEVSQYLNRQKNYQNEVKEKLSLIDFEKNNQQFITLKEIQEYISPSILKDTDSDEQNQITQLSEEQQNSQQYSDRVQNYQSQQLTVNLPTDSQKQNPKKDQNPAKRVQQSQEEIDLGKYLNLEQYNDQIHPNSPDQEDEDFGRCYTVIQSQPSNIEPTDEE